MKRMLVALFLVGGAAAGCAKQPPVARAVAPVAGAPAGAAQSDLDLARVVATVDGQAITVKDLDAEISPELDRLSQEKVGLRKQALDQMVIMRLVDAEAKKDGTTQEAWLKKQVDGSTPEASEVDAKKFYDENSAQMGGKSFDDQKSHIVTFLTHRKRQEAANKLFDELKSKAKIQITLDEPSADATTHTPQGTPRTP